MMFRTALISMFLTSTALADTWTVDDDGKADFDNIQAAVDASSDGDEIIVMPGTYTGTGDQVVNMLGKAVWLHSNDVLLRPIIDGEGARRAILCDSGETSKTIIEGFMITNGSADDGGGMYNNGSSPTLTNCTFAGNHSMNDGDGAGMYNNNSSPILIDCTFESNNSASDGGGIYNANSNPALTNCTFSGNRTVYQTDSSQTSYGGGICNNNSSPTLTGCLFTKNKAFLDGGGMFNANSSNPTLTNCTFDANNASYNGGGILNNSSNPTLDGCIFYGNVGRGMYNSNSNPTLENCAFMDNTGGMLNTNSSPTLTNCSFINNSVLLFGGGMFNLWGSNPTLTNCTITGNYALNGGGMFNDGCYPNNSVPVLYDTIICGNGNQQIYNNCDGDWVDGGGNTVVSVCPPCSSDINLDGEVDILDVLLVIWSWDTSCDGCPEDVDGDGTVGFSDLYSVMDSWGTCL